MQKNAEGQYVVLRVWKKKKNQESAWVFFKGCLEAARLVSLANAPSSLPVLKLQPICQQECLILLGGGNISTQSDRAGRERTKATPQLDPLDV